MSLVLRHRAAVMATLAAVAAGEPVAGVAPAMAEDGEGANDYQALLVVLHEHLRQLSEIQSVEARNPVKAQMAATFDPWVNGALEAGRAGNAVQDEIVVTMMIWAIDYRAIDRALDIAEHVLAHGLTLPERYKRSAGCLIAENIATAELDEPGSVTLAQLQRTGVLTVGSDMPDQARAKLCKAMGRSLAKASADFDPLADDAIAGGKPALISMAIDQFQAALRLDRNVGVKKDLEVAQRQLNALTPPPPGEGGGG